MGAAYALATGPPTASALAPLLRAMQAFAATRDTPVSRGALTDETMSPIPQGPDREDVVRRLLERTRAGDGEAYAEIYRMYVRLVHHYLFRRMGASDELEALTNETFLQAYQALRRYEHRSEPQWRGWLLGVARFVLAGERRRDQSTVPVDDREIHDLDGPSPEDAINRADLERGLALLTDEQRDVIRLRFFERLSHAEIGRRLGREAEAVRAMQYRALRRMRGLLEEAPG